MIDLTTPLDELGLSEETLQALTEAEADCRRFHAAAAADKPCIAPGSAVADVLDQLVTIVGRRNVFERLGRSAYVELVAELDDHRVLPKRWGLGVEPWTPRTYAPRRSA